jgi:histidinol dehydrogenase
MSDGVVRTIAPLAAVAGGRAALAGAVDAGGTLVQRGVERILARVVAEGDAALIDLTRALDGVATPVLEVPREQLGRALAALPAEVRVALTRAAGNLERVHAAMRPAPVRVEPELGVSVTLRPDPLARVGVYAPGGRAAYASSVLMGVIPARVAGVGEVVVCSPPGTDGAPAPAVLAACALAGADRVFALGGAQAIAALAYGTATVPAVDRILGPGNAWVTEAKRQVSARVAIDSPAGPSEVLVIADPTVDPARIARELVAQAEHDPDALAVAVLLGGDAGAAARVVAALAFAVADAPRRAIAAAALRTRGAVLWGDDDAALAFAAQLAPEHLLLAGPRAEALAPWVRNAGAVFLGDGAAVAFGDYLTGGNHVLPTGGLARACSGLSTLDCVRWTSVQTVDARAARALAPAVAALAAAEGLPAHAAAVAPWLPVGTAAEARS